MPFPNTKYLFRGQTNEYRSNMHIPDPGSLWFINHAYTHTTDCYNNCPPVEP